MFQGRGKQLIQWAKISPLSLRDSRGGRGVRATEGMNGRNHLEWGIGGETIKYLYETEDLKSCETGAVHPLLEIEGISKKFPHAKTLWTPIWVTGGGMVWTTRSEYFRLPYPYRIKPMGDINTHGFYPHPWWFLGLDDFLRPKLGGLGLICRVFGPLAHFGVGEIGNFFEIFLDQPFNHVFIPIVFFGDWAPLELSI